MFCEQRLPPSGRDFEVFSAVILAGQSTREAAASFRLSQTRVCQIVERVKKWQAEVVGAADAADPQSTEKQPSEERLLHLAKCIAAGRLDHLYGEAMRAWERSQGQLKKTRSSRFGDEVTTISASCGDTRYLLAAMRLTKAQAELPAAAYSLFPEADDEEESSGRPEARPTPHPEEDCSAICDPQPAGAAAATAACDATDDLPMASAARKLGVALARRSLFGPVQPPPPAAEDGLLAVGGRSTRQQRRRLKRMQRAG